MPITHLYLNVKCSLLLPDFYQKQNMSTNFSEILLHQVSSKYAQCFSSSYMHTDGQTNTTKLTRSFLSLYLATAHICNKIHVNVGGVIFSVLTIEPKVQGTEAMDF